MTAPVKLHFPVRNAAVQWASATRSQLVSYFRSFFTSCDASPASLSCLPVADELPVVIEVPPASDAECANPVSPPGQLAAAAWHRCCRTCIQGFTPDPAHPIVVLFQSQELGKAVLGLSVTIITGLLSDQYRHLSHLHASLITLGLCAGFTATWSGMMLREVWPRVGSTSENIGMVAIFVAFFGLVASFLPPSLVWASWLCCVFSCLPFFLCMKPPDPANKRGLT
ncbi:hypothetical protein BT93_L5083 [Corymbia citriodora subsp. variegata]|uniref:Uncharacterized protein n=1 Tax=Corymbia citriodora subsp. variegata TaxID=360336 RepID=A0A8T0CU91_CORYI|nr:hypothetical protein BT93_L5083 [Corymbia citriodora subsp. variegata]